MRKLLALVASVLCSVGMMLFSPGNASALGGEWLGCRIAPGWDFNYHEYCSSGAPPDSNGIYGVAWRVQNETAASTYTWAVPSSYQSSIASGCTSTTEWCTLWVPPENQTINVSVTLTQGGSSVTLSATAIINATYCDPICV